MNTIRKPVEPPIVQIINTLIYKSITLKYGDSYLGVRAAIRSGTVRIQLEYGDAYVWVRRPLAEPEPRKDFWRYLLMYARDRFRQVRQAKLFRWK